MRIHYLLTAGISLFAISGHSFSKQLPAPAPTTTTTTVSTSTTTTTIRTGPITLRDLENDLAKLEAEKKKLIEHVQVQETFLRDFAAGKITKQPFGGVVVKGDILEKRHSMMSIDIQIMLLQNKIISAKQDPINGCPAQNQVLKEKVEALRDNAVVNAGSICEYMASMITASFDANKIYEDCFPMVVLSRTSGESSCLPSLSPYNVLIVSGKNKPIPVSRTSLPSMRFSAGTKVYSCRSNPQSFYGGNFVLEKTYY